MPKVLKEKILSNEKLAPKIYKMTVQSEYVSTNVMPGQFVNVKCGEGINALMRRPISVCSVDRDKSTFDMVYQIKGIGTEYLAREMAGGEVDIIAPLGKGFDVSPEYKRIAVIGGGIGVFPLLYLLNSSKALKKSTFLGFRNKEYVVLTEDFKEACDSFFISSDDGSVGNKGIVTELLEKDLEENSYDIIYTCGPLPMIKSVVDIANRNNIRCQVSLEQRMGCGIGACLVCACKTRLGDDWEYSHVCKDGPVFWSDEVII